MIDPIPLKGLALSNYKGIGNDVQYMGPFERFNFFIGTNNSGKSTIIEFIAKYSKHIATDHSATQSRSNLVLEEHEVNLDTRVREPIIATCVSREDLQKELSTHFDNSAATQALFDVVLDHLCKTKNCAWLKSKNPHPSNKPYITNIETTSLYNTLSEAERTKLSQLWENTRFEASDSAGRLINSFLQFLFKNVSAALPPANLIPAMRQASKSAREEMDFSGRGLIELFAKLQNPSSPGKNSHEPFDKINAFLKTVTDNQSAKIEIPHDKESIFVHLDGKYLPLSSLGTGIHQVIILAAYCTILKDQIICIEEPETHLHPTLQRRLIKYLESETSNQYFIATHSSCIIDTVGAAIFHVENIDGETRVSSAPCDQSRLNIIRDLGYKASDIIQTNFIIWVEGPSDKIYINHWLSSLETDLKEGIHYSIMFYGGRLLSHLSTDEESSDEDLEGLIAIQKLNQNLAFVIDSDRKSQSDTINATKQRIFDEIEKLGCMCWITEGREIENYLATTQVASALEKCHSRIFDSHPSQGTYIHPLHFLHKKNREIYEKADKVRIARSICEEKANLEILDLKERIGDLVQRIKQAN